MDKDKCKSSFTHKIAAAFLHCVDPSAAGYANTMGVAGFSAGAKSVIPSNPSLKINTLHNLSVHPNSLLDKSLFLGHTSPNCPYSETYLIAMKIPNDHIMSMFLTFYIQK